MLIITETPAKFKLNLAMQLLNYQEIRMLLHFWTSSKFLLRATYFVNFMCDKTLLPMSHTCSFTLDIPDVPTDILVKRIRQVIQHSCTFGFI